MSNPSVSSVIAEVRRELAEAQKASLHEEIKFLIGEVAVELEVEVETRGTGEGGIRLGVVNFGVKGERGKTSSNRILVSLKPTTVTGDDLHIAAEADHRPDGMHTSDG